MTKIQLGVNIDHVATLRQARGTVYPDPLFAALLAEQHGADNITLHLREDRRHIQDKDVWAVKEAIQIPLNFEMALTEEMLSIAEKLCPWQSCLVPEKREERTTEGGLDVKTHFKTIQAAVKRLNAVGTQVSLFIAADLEQIRAAHETGCQAIEIHTGEYALQPLKSPQMALEAARIQQAAVYAHELGLEVHAGHGLNPHNVMDIAAIPSISTLNIGHAIVAQALWMGFGPAVADIKRLMREART